MAPIWGPRSPSCATASIRFRTKPPRQRGGRSESLHCGRPGSAAQPGGPQTGERPLSEEILERLCEVGAGEIITYQALGAWAGAPRAPRAVGGAMHDNPVPIYVPCHRVIRSDGSLGGYGGGLDIKRKLLRAEGFSITTKGLVADATRYGATGAHRSSAVPDAGRWRARTDRICCCFATPRRASRHAIVPGLRSAVGRSRSGFPAPHPFTPPAPY